MEFLHGDLDMVEKEVVNDYYRLPKVILLLSRILDILSPYLASRLLLFFFTRPIYFKTPDREFEFLEKSELSRILIPELNKNLQIYRLRNEGEKVLFIHGWNGRGSQFHQIAKECHNTGFDVTVFDLPGHGKSTSRSCNMPEIVSCIDHLNKKIGPFDHVISHSIGSVAALNSVKGENDFQSIVTISLPSLKIRPLFNDFVGMFGLPEKKYTDMMFGYFERKYKEKVSSFDPIGFASSLHIRSLIIHCKDDRDADMSSSKGLHLEMANSEIILTEGLGHRRILRSELVSESIVNFLRGHTSA